MNKYMKYLIILLTVSVIVLLNGCSKTSTDGTGTGNKRMVTFNVQNSPATIDPQLGTSLAAAEIDSMCMEGLLILGRDNGKVIPGVAKSWTVSKDGLKWTFFLRKNAKWSNGESVTAHDFNFAFKRALTPSTATQFAFMLYGIKNAELFNEGKIKDFSDVGVKVIDDFTLEITINNPVPYFAQVVTTSISMPLNEKFYNKVKDKYTLSADTMLYNGPYIIKDSVPNGKYVFEKNKYYWNNININLENITFLMVNNYNTAADMFQNGSLSMTAIKSSQIPKFKNSGALHTIPDGSIYCLEFNIKNKIFSNTDIRRAIGLAIDRDTLCKEVLKNGSIPARSFVPPGINGGVVNDKPITFRKRYGNQLFNFNLTEAQKLYAKGLKELGYKFSCTNNKPDCKINVKLLLQNDSADLRNCQYIQQQLFKNLGINVVLVPNTMQGQLQKIDMKNYDFTYTNWEPEYNDPSAFLNIYTTKDGQNDTNWSNADYDKLIEIAETSPSNKIRMPALHKAEEILMNKMIISPLFFGVNSTLIKQWLKDVQLMGCTTALSFNWAYVEDKK